MFFQANVEVEAAVQIRDLHKTQKYKFKDTFLTASLKSTQLLEDFGAYQDVHLSIAPSDKELFTEQQSNLQQLRSMLKTLSEIVIRLNEFRLLQEQIWDDNQYTDLFTRAAQSICDCVSWQVKLARDTNLSEGVL